MNNVPPYSHPYPPPLASPDQQSLVTIHPYTQQPAPAGMAWDLVSGQLVALPNSEFHDPLWQAWARGEATLEKDANGQTMLVPNSAYETKQGLQINRPTNELGTTAQAIIDQPAEMARIDLEGAESLTAYVRCLSPDEPSNLGITPAGAAAGITTLPLNVAPVGSPPVGGAVSIARVKWGHKGVQFVAWLDAVPGQTLKLPVSGSEVVTAGRLAPKYYKNDDNNLVAGKRVYLVNPGGVQLSNALFNNLPNNIMTLNGLTNPNAAVFEGFVAKGFAAIPSQNSQPTRRFYGTVKTTGAIQGQNTLTPVPWNCVGVTMTGGVFVPAAGAFFPVSFMMNGPTGSAQVGPFAANDGIIHPLIENCQSIEVFNSAASAAGTEIPFELTFYLSF